MKTDSGFHLRALRAWQVRESQTIFFSAQVVVAELFGNLEEQSQSFSKWAQDVAADAASALISVAADVTAARSINSRTENATAAAVRGSAGAHEIIAPTASNSVERLELELAALRAQLAATSVLASPPVTPQSPPAPPREKDYGGIPVAWPVPETTDSVAGGNRRGERGLNDSWPSSPPPVAPVVDAPPRRFSPIEADSPAPARQLAAKTGRTQLSEVKNSFGPRLAAGVGGSNGNAKGNNSTIVSPPHRATSWRDL